MDLSLFSCREKRPNQSFACRTRKFRDWVNLHPPPSAEGNNKPSQWLFSWVGTAIWDVGSCPVESVASCGTRVIKPLVTPGKRATIPSFPPNFLFFRKETAKVILSALSIIPFSLSRFFQQLTRGISSPILASLILHWHNPLVLTAALTDVLSWKFKGAKVEAAFMLVPEWWKVSETRRARQNNFRWRLWEATGEEGKSRQSDALG